MTDRTTRPAHDLAGLRVVAVHAHPDDEAIWTGGLLAQLARRGAAVDVVPGDQAAGRVPDPTVRTELTFLRTQQAKRAAAERMSAGDAGGV